MSILEDLKSLVGTIQKIDNIELYRQILDLQNEVLQVVAENTQLKADAASLREQLQPASDFGSSSTPIGVEKRSKPAMVRSALTAGIRRVH